MHYFLRGASESLALSLPRDNYFTKQSPFAPGERYGTLRRPPYPSVSLSPSFLPVLHVHLRDPYPCVDSQAYDLLPHPGKIRSLSVPSTTSLPLTHRPPSHGRSVDIRLSSPEERTVDQRRKEGTGKLCCKDNAPSFPSASSLFDCKHLRMRVDSPFVRTLFFLHFFDFL